MRKYLLFISAIALFIAASCSSESEAESQPVVNSTPRFVISLQATEKADHYWSVIQKSAVDKAKEIEVDLVASSANDAQTQVKQLEDEIAKGVSGLAVAPIDVSLLGSVQKKAQEANIPFVVIETQAALPDAKIVGTDEEAAGRLAADYVCNPESEIITNKAGFAARNTEAAIISGATNDLVSLARAKGGRWGLEDCNLKVVEEKSANSDQAQAENAAKEIIGQYPDIRVLLVTDDIMALGAAKAVKELGKTGAIVIISFVTAAQVVEAIIAGDVTASIAPNPEIIGARSVESLYMLLDEQSIPDRYDTGTRLITIQNASQFR